MQHMEVFQYVTALDINMVYYNISLSLASHDMTTIVTENFKLDYNCLPMSMCASGDIFRAKLYKLIGDIEGVKTYIDDILVFSKDSFSKHIEELRIIVGRFCAAGLKVNDPKCSFG